MTDVVQLLRELIALPSVNPAFLPAGDARGGERRMADYLAAVGASGGLDIEFQEVLPDRSNVLLRLAPRGAVRQSVWLAPHLDTVPDPAAGPLTPSVRGGKIFGRGACDTKGSIAAMLAALLDLAQSPDRPQATEIILAGLVDEESHQAGSRALVASGRRADLAIVGEPTHCRVVTAHKGDAWLTLETQGKAAHGSTPELGRNAVLEMARIVQLLELTYARQLRRKKHPLLGVPTVNVGKIMGGRQPNIVPSECAIEVDRRLLPGETPALVRRELAALLRQHSLRARIRDQKGLPCPALETNVRRPLVRQFMQAAGCPKPLGVPFFCDAAILAAGGTPSVVFGPGGIAQAHTDDEWIAVAELRLAAVILRRFLSSLP